MRRVWEFIGTTDLRWIGLMLGVAVIVGFASAASFPWIGVAVGVPTIIYFSIWAILQH